MIAKTLLIIPLIAILLLFFCCTKEIPPVTTEVVVMEDFTDSLVSRPTIERIQQVYGFDKNIYNGARFRYLYITELDINLVFEIFIELADKSETNRFKRQSKVDQFIAEIDSFLVKRREDSVGRDSSAIYRNVAKEANRLSQSTSETRVLMSYSDMMENTNEISFYNQQDIDSLKRSPLSIEKVFEEQVSLRNLQGIEIHIIFQPTTPKQNRLFNVVSEFYGDLFVETNANIYINENKITK